MNSEENQRKSTANTTTHHKASNRVLFVLLLLATSGNVNVLIHSQYIISVQQQLIQTQHYDDPFCPTTKLYLLLLLFASKIATTQYSNLPN